MFVSFFLHFCACVLCECVAHFFCCTRVFKQDNLHSTGNRVDRQMDYWLLVLVVAVVVMGLPAKGCQAGGAVSLKISQDQPPPSSVFLQVLTQLAHESS